jgi:hypothetical protein
MGTGAGRVATASGPSDSSHRALCFEQCTLGASPNTKCHGTAHVACAPLEGNPSGYGFCRPVCASGADCGGSYCDPVRGICVSHPGPDRTFGRLCASDAAHSSSHDAGANAGLDAADTARALGDAGSDARTGAALTNCDDLCVEVNQLASTCSRRCVFGSTEECAPASGGLRRGACTFVTANGSIGDLGYCAELCDCKDDCVESMFECDAFDNPTLESSFGRKGVCTPPELVLGHPIACQR